MFQQIEFLEDGIVIVSLVLRPARGRHCKIVEYTCFVGLDASSFYANVCDAFERMTRHGTIIRVETEAKATNDIHIVGVNWGKTFALTEGQRMWYDSYARVMGPECILRPLGRTPFPSHRQ